MGTWWDDGNPATPDEWLNDLDVYAVNAGALLGIDTILAGSVVEEDGSFAVMEAFNSSDD